MPMRRAALRTVDGNRTSFPVPSHTVSTSAPINVTVSQSRVVRELSNFASDLRAAKVSLDMLQQRRAAERAANSVGVDPGDGLQQDPDCPICFDTLTKPSSVVTACGHMFHEKCILKAIKDKSRPACPLCRSSMHPAELRRVMNGIPENIAASKGDPEVVEIDPETRSEEVIDLTSDLNGGPENATHEKCVCGSSAMDNEILEAVAGIKRLLNEGEALKDLETHLVAASEEKTKAYEQLEKELREEHDRIAAKMESDRMEVRRQKIDAEKIKEELKERMIEQKRQAANMNELRAKLDFERQNIESMNLELQRKQEVVEAEREALALKSKKMDDLIEQKAEKRANKKVFDKYKEIASLKRQLEHLRSKSDPVHANNSSESDSDGHVSSDSDDDDGLTDVVGAAEREYERQGSCKKRMRVKTMLENEAESPPSKNDGKGISLISAFSADPMRAPNESNWPPRPRAMQRSRNPKKRSAGSAGLLEFVPKRPALQRPSAAVAQRLREAPGPTTSPAVAIGLNRKVIAPTPSIGSLDVGKKRSSYQNLSDGIRPAIAKGKSRQVSMFGYLGKR